MNVWLKEISLKDDKTYYDLLMELSNYKDVYARPVQGDMEFSEFEYFKQARVDMKNGESLPEGVMPTTTYWVMEENLPIGYATLKHQIDLNSPGGHFGLCLKKEWQNKGIGSIVSELLSRIAYEDLGIKEVVYTAKEENKQSQRSLEKIGATLISIHDGYHFYSVDLSKKYKKEGRKV